MLYRYLISFFLIGSISCAEKADLLAKEYFTETEKALGRLQQKVVSSEMLFDKFYLNLKEVHISKANLEEKNKQQLEEIKRLEEKVKQLERKKESEEALNPSFYFRRRGCPYPPYVSKNGSTIKNSNFSFRLDLINELDNTGRSPLHHAILERNFELAIFLISKGANVNIKSRTGSNTPLHMAVSKEDKEMITFLLRYGADPNYENHKGNTPLHIATINEKEDIMSLLLNSESKADPNYKNRRGNTPLHLAVRRGNKVIVSLLLEHKADPKYKNNKKKIPLYKALKEKKIDLIPLLLDVSVDFKNVKRLIDYALLTQEEEIIDLVLKAAAKEHHKSFPSSPASFTQTPCKVSHLLS